MKGITKVRGKFFQAVASFCNSSLQFIIERVDYALFRGKLHVRSLSPPHRRGTSFRRRRRRYFFRSPLLLPRGSISFIHASLTEELVRLREQVEAKRMRVYRSDRLLRGSQICFCLARIYSNLQHVGTHTAPGERRRPLPAAFCHLFFHGKYEGNSHLRNISPHLVRARASNQTMPYNNDTVRGRWETKIVNLVFEENKTDRCDPLNFNR